MPETIYLQIQGGDADASHVVELPGAAIRVGRGSVCEVRLADPELAEVQCLLRRRGETWHVQPLGPAGLVSIAGEAVDQIRPLPLDEPLRVGSFRLLIRSEGDGFRKPIEVGPSTEDDRGASEEEGRRVPAGAGGRVATVPGSEDAEGDRSRRWQGRVELRERWLQARQDEKKWEARWRAAGEGLRSRAASTEHRKPTASSPRVEIGRHPTPDRSDTPRLVEPPVSRIVPAIPRPSVRVEILEPEGRKALPGPVLPATPIESTPRSVPQGISEGVEAPPRAVATSNSLEQGVTDRPSSALRILEAEENPLSTAVIGAETACEPEPIVSPSFAGGERPEEVDTAPTFGSFEVDFADDSERRDGEEPEEIPASPARTRFEPKPAPHHEPTVAVDLALPTGRDRAEFPGASTILAAQGRRAIAEPAQPATNRRRSASRPTPTDPVDPSLWSLPSWVAVPPAALGAVALLGVGLLLAFAWAGDNLSAGVAARSALRSATEKPAMLDPDARIETRWWRTTAGHLALWSAAIERSPEAATRADEVRDALDSARRAAPLQASARFAASRSAAGGDTTSQGSAVGLSRDIAALTLTGRMLKQSGKVESALRAYRRALEIAAGADAMRLEPPMYDDDPQVRRFRLPHEAIVGGVIRNMIAAGGWGFAEWSPAMPPSAVVRLAAARILREGGNPDAERAFGLVLVADVESPASPGPAAEHHAAQAEALAMTERKSEAASRYRTAIQLAEDDPTRRRWSFALAEVLVSLGESRERAELLEAAKGADPNDEVSKKALDAQQFAGLK